MQYEKLQIDMQPKICPSCALCVDTPAFQQCPEATLGPCLMVAAVWLSSGMTTIVLQSLVWSPTTKFVIAHNHCNKQTNGRTFPCT